MNRSIVLSRIVGLAISIGVVVVGLPAFAANTSWFATQKQVLRQKLESAPPVTFKFIGDRIFPVFVKQSPKYTVIVESLDTAPSGSSNVRAMR